MADMVQKYLIARRQLAIDFELGEGAGHLRFSRSGAGDGHRARRRRALDKIRRSGFMHPPPALTLPRRQLGRMRGERPRNRRYAWMTSFFCVYASRPSMPPSWP
jgi:hypothetical protein